MEWACLEGLSGSHIKDAASACKNARFELNQPSRESLLLALNELPDKLGKISVRIREQDGSANVFAAAWDVV